MNNENIVLSDEEKEYLKKIGYTDETIKLVYNALTEKDIDDLETMSLEDDMFENPERVLFFIELFNKYSTLSKSEVLEHFKFAFKDYIDNPSNLIFSVNAPKEAFDLKMANVEKCLDKVEELIRETKSPLQQREEKKTALEEEGKALDAETVSLKTQLDGKAGQDIGEE